MPPGRIYLLRDLPEKGIRYSSVHLRRLIKAGQFPPPIYLSPRRPAWTEAQLDAWISEREIESSKRRWKETKLIT